jgi:hypothetical protein
MVVLYMEFFLLFQLHQKNGKPHKITDSRIVHVEILHKGEKMSCTKQLDKDNSNSVSISFTVHKSGTYKIHVMVNGKHCMSCFLLPFCISPHDEHRSSGPRPVKLFGPVNISVFISRTAVLQKT